MILVFAACSSRSKQETVWQPPLKKTPNIVIILADDLGYSDLGFFGSEIATPNIDALASRGQVFTNFYVAATCSPTRAMLLSGTDNHVAGLGDMAERVISIPEQYGKPGYEGYLNDRVVSVAQLLKDAGYHTYIAGKWHLGLTADRSPAAGGFERSFALLDAYSNHFFPDSRTSFWENDRFAQYPAGEYSTDLYTDKLIGFLRKDKDDPKPFFLYAAYTSPHWPLQAPQEYIEKYRGVYDIGYDSLRVFRFEQLKKRGMVDAGVILPDLPLVEGNLYDISNRPLRRWKSLSKDEQHIEARKMEIYAGMIDNLDHNIGRLIGCLKEIGQYDNTLFIFFSDNGPAALESNATPNDNDPYPYMGTANSFVAYGAPWAHASSAVNSYYKGYSAEGGIHSPMIVSMPHQQGGHRIVSAFATVMDIAPTMLDVAGTAHPPTYSGRTIAPYLGTSLLSFLQMKKDSVHGEDYVMGWELFGRCAIRKGKWKISRMERPFGKGIFELYDLHKDPTESHDLSKAFPEVYEEMLRHWAQYVKDNGVIADR